MRSGFRAPVAILLAAAAFCSAAKERISILDFTRLDVSAKRLVTESEIKDLTQQVRDKATSLVDTSRFEIMTLENIMVMLPPGKKQLEDCVGVCEVEMARNIGSRWHVVGDVKKVGKKLVLSIRLYDVTGGSQLGGVRSDGASVDALVDGVSALAEKLLGKIPGIATVPTKAAESIPSRQDAEGPGAPPVPGLQKYVVSFSSVPEGAAVSADGNFLCTAPNSKALAQGDHWISMGKDGYRQKKELVSVTGNDQRIAFTLPAIETRLSLEAVDDRTGADLSGDVYVDGSKVGQTPFDGLVPVAAQTIEVSVAGVGRKSASVFLQEGKSASSTVHFQSQEPRNPVSTQRVSTPATGRAGMLDAVQTPWTEILSANVKGDRVDYAGVLKEKAKFEGYLSALAAIDSNAVKSASKEERTAFYINAYNAAVFQLVLNNPKLGSVAQMPGNITGAKVILVAQESLAVAEIFRKKVMAGNPDPLLWSLICDGSLGSAPILDRAILSQDIPTIAEQRTRAWLADTSRNKIDAMQTTIAQIPFDFFRFKPEFKGFPGGVMGFLKKYGPVGCDPETNRPTFVYNGAKNSVVARVVEPKGKKK